MRRILAGGGFLAASLLFLLPAGGSCEGVTPIQRVLSGETRWEGDVSIDGVVIVTGEGSLSIGAGSRVLFTPRDDDGDGIGDSELRVEGVLRVEGTPDNPVLFTSAAALPAAADWKYIMINHARGAHVEHAVIQYAYSGIQVHYTRGTFRGLVARHNVDGFRFSTAPVLLENSLLTRNENGIRFEERGAGAVIRGNRITRNRIGVFAVIKCRGLTAFENNSIDENTDYAVKMGLEQREDLPMDGNYWGPVDPEKIPESFFDGRIEPSLGKVLYTPHLEERPEWAGKAENPEVPRPDSRPTETNLR